MEKNASEKPVSSAHISRPQSEWGAPVTPALHSAAHSEMYKSPASSHTLSSVSIIDSKLQPYHSHIGTINNLSRTRKTTSSLQKFATRRRVREEGCKDLMTEANNEPSFEKPWLVDWKKETNWDSIIFYSSVFVALGKFPVSHASG